MRRHLLIPLGRFAKFSHDGRPRGSLLAFAPDNIATRIPQLQDENGRLKKLVAELTLDRAMLQDVLRKNW